MKGGVAGLGQLHPLHAAVVGIAGPPHKSRPFKPGQVVGERRPFDPERLGQLSLGAPAAALERQQNEPGGLAARALGPMRAEIEDEICEGDKVVARVTMHGRHVGEFLGKAPTGKEYAVEHIHIWRLQDGKVIEHWSVRDDLGQALQLGLVGA